jgi:hypothetical protein
MKALISPNEGPIYHVSSWTDTIPSNPVVEAYPNSARVAQVSQDTDIFPVADPMYWTDCPNETVADTWWCNTSTNVVSEIVDTPKP